jgi:hypothetical protein
MWCSQGPPCVWKHVQCARCQALTVAVMKSCSLRYNAVQSSESQGRFEGTYRLHQGRIISKAANQYQVDSKPGLFSDTEDKRKLFPRNVSWLSTRCMTSQNTQLLMYKAIDPHFFFYRDQLWERIDYEILFPARVRYIRARKDRSVSCTAFID